MEWGLLSIVGGMGGLLGYTWEGVVHVFYGVVGMVRVNNNVSSMLVLFRIVSNKITTIEAAND